jgi:signal peptidase II
VLPIPAVTLMSSAILLAALDQAIKAFVLARLGDGQAASFGWIGIRRVINLRVGGVLSLGVRPMVILWAAETVVLVALVQFGPFFHGAVPQVALGVALGGATGNFMDRLWRGGVVDFIDVGFWPVFNLADAAIVAGALIAVFHI